MEALEAVAAVHLELSCPLCHKVMREPQTFNTPMCGHTFCRDCVTATLEGPGIVKSQCPTCKQPAWKKDLHTNHKYTAIAEATVHLAAVLRSQGLDFQSFSGLEQPAGDASNADALGVDGDDAEAAGTPPAENGNAVAAHPLGTNVLPASEHCEKVEAIAPQCAVEVDSNADVHPSNQAAGRVAEQQPAPFAAEGQEEVIPDSGSGPAAVMGITAMVAGPAVQQQQHCHPAQPSLDGGGSIPAVAGASGGASILADLMPVAGSSGPQQQLAQQQRQQLQEPAEHSQRHQQSVHAATQQQFRQQQLQQEHWYAQQAPSHLLQQSLGMNDEQLPGRSYWHFQRLLESMVHNMQVDVRQQQQQVHEQQQQDLPPCFASILEQLSNPTAPELQAAQQDLQDIDALLADVSAALEGVSEGGRLQHKQQHQCLSSQQQQPQQQKVFHSCCTTCTTQDPTEAPSISELHHQQQQQPAAVAPPGRQLSLRTRRRGTASGRSRAAGAFSGGFLGKGPVGTAGDSGVQLGACSGAGVSFSNCSGPLVGHTGRPSLERAIDAAMAAARAADCEIDQVQEVAAQQQQLEAWEHKAHLQQPASAVEQQQQQPLHQLGLQSNQSAASASVGGSAPQARSKKGGRVRAASGDEAGSGSLTSETAGRRRSRRAAAAATKASLNVAHAIQPGSTIIGVRLKVYWPADKCYYTGRVTDYNPRNKKHTVAYEDGDTEQLDLTKEDYIPLFSEDEQEQQLLGSEQQTEQRVCDQHRQQEAAGQGAKSAAVVAVGCSAGQQQHNVPKTQQQQSFSAMHQQEMEPLVSARRRTAAADSSSQAAGDVRHPQPQPPQQPQVPQKPQQQTLWNLRQQLLQAKGLATSKQCREQHQQQHKQQHQQSVSVQQQESPTTSSLQARRPQQQQPLQQHHQHQKPPAKSRVGAAGCKRKRRRHDCDSDLSSSSSSLRGSDVTSGGDSAYEAVSEPRDSDDSDECAAAHAARAKRGAVLLESECVSDLEVAAAADSDDSDSFLKQQLKSRRAKAKSKQAAANRAKQQQQHKQRQRHHQAGAAGWHSKRQKQQQGNRRSSAPPSMQQQQEPVLVSDGDADVVDDRTTSTSAGPTQRQQAAGSLQQRQQQRRDQLLQQEAEAAWAVMEQQLSDQVSSDLPEDSESEPESESADADLDIDPTPDLQHSTAAPAEQTEAEVSVGDDGQTAAELLQPLAAAAQQEIGSSQLQGDVAITTGEPAEQHSQREGTRPVLQQQRLDHVDQHAVAVAKATRPGNTAQQSAGEGKYCDLLSDSTGTSYSSSQHVVSSQEHNENTTTADMAGLQPQQQAAGAGACGVVHAPQSSSRPVSKQQRTASQRKPLGCVPAGRQQPSAATPDGAVGDKSRCMDMQPAVELLPLPPAEAPAAAAQTTDGCDAEIKRLVTVIGSMDKDTVGMYQPVLRAMGADFAVEVNGKYSHCVVVPVDEHGYFHSNRKAVLTALVLGVPVVKHTWLQDSVDLQCLLPVQDYLPKGRPFGNRVLEGGPTRSLAAKDHDKRLFEGLAVVVAAVNQTQVAVQQTLAMLAVMGRARTLLHGPGLQRIVAEPDRRPIAAAAAAELCKDRRVFVLLIDKNDHASAGALQQCWPTAEVVAANYLTECICAYQILDPQPYVVEQ